VVYTIEELRHDWQVVAKDLPASTGFQAVLAAGQRPGIYRTAAAAEPARRYFWLAPNGRLETMDRARGKPRLGNRPRIETTTAPRR